MPVSPITGATYTGYTRPPVSLGRTNPDVSSDYLYKATLPDSDEDAGFALVYSKSAPRANSDGDALFGSSAFFLQTTDGQLFSVDADRLTFVASSSGLALYTYSDSSAGSAEKYTFSTAGIQTSADQPAILTAKEISAEESRTLRDIDGNGGVGAYLDADEGIIDSAGGLYKVDVAGETVYVWGSALDKSKYIDVSTNALLNSDGTFWSPDAETSDLKIVRTVASDKTATYKVFLTDGDDITEYTFGNNRRLLSGSAGTRTLSATDLAGAETTAKRDLNADSVFGVEITVEIDKKAGLYKGELLGQQFYLVGTSLKVGAGSAVTPNNATGALRDENDDPWELSEGFAIGGAIVSGNRLTMYTYNEDDTNEVTAYTFTKSGTDWLIDDDAGNSVDAFTLAAVEKANKRDLNSDDVYGITVDGAVDKSGGLYQVSALGNTFLVVGRNVVSSASKPFDLSTTLVDADGNAWAPDDVEEMLPQGSDPNILTIVTRLNGGETQGFDVYVREDSGSVSKYTFGNAGADLYTLQVDEDGIGRVELNQEEIASAEKATLRDLNGDRKFGVVFGANAVIDKKGNLYKGSFGDDIDTVYLVQNTPPAIGSTLAARAVDFTSALYNSEGSDYWNVDDPEGYTVKSAYESSGVYHIYAVSNDDSTAIQHYQFSKYPEERDDGDPFQWRVVLDEETGLEYTEPSITDFSQIEDAVNRDLNGDNAVGVKITSTADKLGGLHVGTAFGKNFLVYGPTAPQASNLASALTNGDGTAWGADEDGNFDAEIYDPTTDALSFKKRSNNLYDLYVARTIGDETTVKKYEFDGDFKLKEDDYTGVTLSGIALASAEKDTGRDLNGDKTVGAKYVASLDKTGGLHSALIGGETFYVYSALKPDKGMTLENKVLYGDDGETPWSIDTDDNSIVAIQKLATDEDDANTVDGYYIYTKSKADENLITRHTFSKGRAFKESEDLDAATLASDEKTFGRDFSSDKAVGIKVEAATDKVGGLYRASVLGQTFYVASNAILKTGTNSTNAADLSKALFDGEGSAWTPGSDFIAGMTTDDAGNYLVFTYTKDGDGNVDTVTKHSWNEDLEYQESVDADPLELIEFEIAEKRDLSGDGFVGFRVLSANSEEGYKGVTEAKVIGNQSYWIVCSAVKQGTKTSPLGFSKVLLTSDGSGAWAPEGYFIKSVVDVDDDTRHVYVTNYTGEDEPADGSPKQVLRYTFDRATGQVSEDDPEEITGVELSKIEFDLKKDLDDDGYKGAHYVAKHSTADDLLKVTSLGSEFLVVKSAPRNGQIINLEKALLDADGNAWTADDGVTLRGTYVNDSGLTEVYGTWDEDNDTAGTSAGDVKRYTFEAVSLTVDSTTVSVLQLVTDSAFNSDQLRGAQVALREAAAKKDFDGDSSIGYKATASTLDDDTTVIKQANGLTLGTAITGVPGDSAIFIVGKNLNQMGSSQKSALANNAALLLEAYEGTGDELDDEDALILPKYFELDANVKIMSIFQSATAPNSLVLYGKQFLDDVPTGVDDPKNYYIKYSFTRSAETSPWILDAIDDTHNGEEFSPADTDPDISNLVKDETMFKRDFNNDGAIGLSVDSTFNNSGSLTIVGEAKKVFRAKIDELQFYLIGNGMTTGTTIKPFGFPSGVGLLKDADGKAWLPDQDVDITEFIKLTTAETSAVEEDEGIAGAAYKATLSDDTVAYFNVSLEVLSDA